MQDKLRIGIVTYLHFLVDFFCVYWMFFMIYRQANGPASCSLDPIGEYRVIWALVYNFCAFALQLPIGWLVDRFCQRKSWWITSLGCAVLSVAGFLIFYECSWMGIDAVCYPEKRGFWCSAALGLGNALFHVGAGVEVMRIAAGESAGNHDVVLPGQAEGKDTARTRYRMTPLGIFVSTGAMGLAVGSYLANHLDIGISEWLSWYESVVAMYSSILLVLMVLAVGLNLLAVRRSEFVPEQAGVDRKAKDIDEKLQTSQDTDALSKQARERSGIGGCQPWNLWIILLLFMVVVLRSFQGSIMQFSWYFLGEIHIVFAFGGCVMLGKALGGILADRIGVFWTVTIPLGVSAVILAVASEYMVPALIAVLLFQTTMPITLSLMQRQCRGYPGTAFGFLSFGLFLGSTYKSMNYLQKSYLLFDVQFPDRESVLKPLLAYHLPVRLQDLLEIPYLSSIVAVISLALLWLILWLWRRQCRQCG